MQSIVGVEISHKNAPIAVREQVAHNKNQTHIALLQLREYYEEIFIISTCNRLSFYAVGNDHQKLTNYLRDLGVKQEHISIYPDTLSATSNLLSTAAGLESQAIGEHQIVGQIKEGHELAKRAKTIGPVLDELIRQAIHTGKRVRKETHIGEYSASLATVGYQLIQQHGYQLDQTNILVIGTGNMANLITTILDRSKVKEIFIASHDTERAEEMAKEWKGKPVNMSELDTVFSICNIIIGGTQGEVNLLSESQMSESKCPRDLFALFAKNQKLLIDFGLPRNFNPILKKLPNVNLYDLDDMKKLTYEGLLKRYDQIPQAKKIIDEETQWLIEWFKSRVIAPVLESYWNTINEIKEEELKWLLPKLGELDEHQKDVISKFAHRLARKMAKGPTLEMRKMAQNSGNENSINTVRSLFGLENMGNNSVKTILKVGTRGSKLALTQTGQVIDQLKKIDPSFDFELKVIRTSGDDGKLDEMGAFTSAIQRALLNKEVDIAVHSFKDLPIEDVKGLKVGAIPKRLDPRDAFISKDNIPFGQLKEGAIVGTGSLRRKIQLLELRPDLQIEFIRGNINTRIKKMQTENYDAILLALSGLKRAGMDDQITEILDEDAILPAAAQGALAIEMRDENGPLRELLAKYDHKETRLATECERAFLVALGGGCNFPIACLAKIKGDLIELKGMYATENGEHIVKIKEKGDLPEHLAIAERAAKIVLAEIDKKKRKTGDAYSSK